MFWIKRSLPAAALVALILLGVSVSIKRESSERIRINLNLGMPAEVRAQESDWGFVRQSATWAKGNSDTIDSLISALRDNGLLDLGAGTHDFFNIDMGGVPVKMRVGLSQGYTVNASAFEAGSKTFSNKVIFWKQADNTKILELFWDTTGSLSGDGALLIYSLHQFSPTEFSNSSAVIESYAFVDGSNNRRQTYSWSGPLTTGAITGQGRVILIEMSGVLCVQSVITLNTGHASGQLCGAGNNYYSLAYGVKTDAPHQTTALFGLAQTSVNNTGTVCGSTNNRNHGRFEDGVFIGDGFAAGDIPADYPTSTAVTTLLGQLGTDPTASDCGGDCDGDDTQQATIDALNTNVQFRDGDSPP